MPRNAGKTTQLINMSASTGDTIVCATQDTVRMICGYARLLGLDIPRPITYSEFINRKYRGMIIKGFLIDNADYFIQHFSIVKVRAITMDAND